MIGGHEVMVLFINEPINFTRVCISLDFWGIQERNIANVKHMNKFLFLYFGPCGLVFKKDEKKKKKKFFGLVLLLKRFRGQNVLCFLVTLHFELTFFNFFYLGLSFSNKIY